MTETQTTVGVVAESGADERRVALVPEGGRAAGEQRRGRSWWSRVRASARCCPTSCTPRPAPRIGDAWAADVVVKVAPPTADEVGRLRSGQTLIGFLAPRNADNSIGALKRGRRAGVRARGHPADLPRAGDGRAVVAGQRRRIQGRPAGRLGVDPLLPDADHGGRDGEAGDRAGARRRGGRAAGAGDGQTAGRAHHRLRRAARGGRPGPLGGGAVAGRRDRRGRRGRVRPRAHRRRARRSSRRRWKTRSADSTW